MLETGDLAPKFTLPGMDNDAIKTFALADAIERDQAVLLLFYPFDFSPVCTNELCAIRDAEFFQLTADVEVWAVSKDSVYAHRAFANEFGLNFPLLSDSQGKIATEYGACYDELQQHERVPKRAIFLISPDQQLRYVWQTNDAYEKPDFFPVKEALDRLVAERENFGYNTADLTVDYAEGPGEVM